jgi:hypothetical protein
MISLFLKDKDGNAYILADQAGRPVSFSTAEEAAKQTLILDLLMSQEKDPETGYWQDLKHFSAFAQTRYNSVTREQINDSVGETRNLFKLVCKKINSDLGLFGLKLIDDKLWKEGSCTWRIQVNL